jgi:hypothetical protein
MAASEEALVPVRERRSVEEKTRIRKRAVEGKSGRIC